jgi:transposase, IS30 family
MGRVDDDEMVAGGGSALTEKRAAFLRLVRQGISNSEACRQVGVNRRTGTRWRYGRTILNRARTAENYPAVILVPDHNADADAGGRYLSERERITIADLRRAG